MTLKKALSEELKNPLPGIEFQMKMAPEGRTQPDFFGRSKKNAAVSVIVCENQPKKYIELILIRRTEYNGHHSGQVSFPGGKADRNDSSLLDTAIRETFEEIGVQLHPDDLLGKLTPLLIPVSGYLVYPYIFYRASMPDFKLDFQEVQYLIRYNVADLLDKTLIQTTQFSSGDAIVKAPYYAIAGEFLWGASAMILAEFIEILKQIKIKNSGLF
jgi:8-oxo-dGTP pyrophosphatase MutT (NUDIX family)